MRRAIRELISFGNTCNRYFNDQAPWKTSRTDRAQCATTLCVCMQATRALALVAFPIMPFSAEKLWKMAGLEGRVDAQKWDQFKIDESLPGRRIGEIEILFPKIDDETINAQVEKLGKSFSGADGRGRSGVADSADSAESGGNDPISIDAFRQIDLRIADVAAAEPVPGTDRLLRLQVRIGEEERQIVSGIAPGYRPDQLVGRQIVVVANLEPASIRGVESQGMLLAASDDRGAPILLGPDVRVQSGSSVT